MRKFFLLSIASLVLLPAAALAAPPSAPAMPLGASTTPPLGLIELCQREPTECVRSGEVDQAKLAEMKVWASQARWAAMFGASPSVLAEAPASAFPSDMRARGAAAERGELAARTALLHALAPMPAASDGQSGDDRSANASTPVKSLDADPAARGDAAAEPTMVATTAVSPLSARETAKINTRINRSIRRMTDAELYGRADYWAGGGDKVKQGDCEDYVMAKRHALINAGVPEDAVSIATVRTRYGELHAVLLVATATGEVVLDNLSPWVLPWNEAPYRWLDRQVGGSPTHWVHVGA